jgi:hypothetical protein
MVTGTDPSLSSVGGALSLAANACTGALLHFEGRVDARRGPAKGNPCELAHTATAAVQSRSTAAGSAELRRWARAIALLQFELAPFEALTSLLRNTYYTAMVPVLCSQHKTWNPPPPTPCPAAGWRGWTRAVCALVGVCVQLSSVLWLPKGGVKKRPARIELSAAEQEMLRERCAPCPSPANPLHWAVLLFPMFCMQYCSTLTRV